MLVLHRLGKNHLADGHAEPIGRFASVETVLKLRQIAVQMLDGNPMKTPNQTPFQEAKGALYSVGVDA